MSLQDWLKSRWLVEHSPTREEIAELFALSERDLPDAEAPGLSPDWQLNIAYNAALQIAVAALAAEGYRAARESHHYRVTQSLGFTVGASGNRIAALDGFRKKRNMAEYERAGRVSEQEAEEMVELARWLQSSVREWVASEHPGLLP